MHRPPNGPSRVVVNTHGGTDRQGSSLPFTEGESLLQHIRELRRNERGFTLIELLIVIVILGILAGIVVFAVNGITDRGAASACKADVKTVSVAAEAAYAQNGKYPNTLALLASSGFLHSQPTDVDYAATDAAITKLEGLAGSACVGYKG